MSRKNEKPIVVHSTVSVKESSDLRQVTHKATAGLSKAEAIERHIIGEYHGTGEDEEGEEEKG